MTSSSDRFLTDLSPFCRELVNSRYLTPLEMEQILRQVQQTGASLTDAIESFTGQLLDPEHIRRYKQERLWESAIIYGVEFIDLAEAEEPEDEVLTELWGYVPYAVCRQYQIFPWGLQTDSTGERGLELLMVDPDNVRLQWELVETLRPHNIVLIRRGILLEDYEDLIHKHASLGEAASPHLRPQADSAREATRVDITAIMEETPPQISALESAGEPDVHAPPKPDGASSPTEDSPVIHLANKILILGLRNGAQELHLDPQEQQMTVQMRRDGKLEPLLEPLPRQVFPALVRRLKIMANLDPNQTKTPLRSKLRKVYEGKPVYFFIHTLPSFYGEKALVRIVPTLSQAPSFDDLGLPAPVQGRLEQLLTAETGLFLVADLKQDNINQTLEALGAWLLRAGRKVGAVADPIQRALPGVTQIELNPDQGLTYSSALRSLAGQGMDAILVDQAADAESARAILKTLQQGCLVIAGIHGQDSADALSQMSQWLPAGALAEIGLGVLSQRRLRKLCGACRVSYHPTPEELTRLGLSSAKPEKTQFYQANTLNPELVKQLRLKERLCSQCRGLGYEGRISVYELSPCSGALRRQLNRNAEAEALRRVMALEQQPTLVTETLARIQGGETSLEELIRVFPDALARLSGPAPALLPPDLQDRLAALETALKQLRGAFDSLKESLGLETAPTATAPVPASKPPAEDLDLSAELLELEQLAAQRRRSQEEEIDPAAATMVGTGAEWDELASVEAEEEIDPKEATVIGRPFGKPEGDPQATEIHPFKSIVDPW
ncbi:MAG: ATPase, T2SS/T4P/T4SS family [Cyanobacteriota bacterium]|nr:ATPase, T2SS/T4P/T4SS family [Cyanobacteriota bacterium]